MLFPLDHFIPHSSITSSEVTSDPPSFDLAIDKLNFTLNDQFSIDVLVKYLDSKKIIHSLYYKKNEIGVVVESFIFFFGSNTRKVYKIKSNPNQHENFRDYAKSFKKILPPELKRLLRISQVDFAINIYNIHYAEILKTLNVNSKQSYSRVSNNRIDRRTIYIGKEPCATTAYDKKLKISKSKTRRTKRNYKYIENLIEKSDQLSHWAVIEVQLKGELLPTRKVRDFVRSIKSLDFNPFKSHELANYNLKSELEVDKKSQPKIMPMMISLECIGFFETKKNNNIHDNFCRDFKKIAHLGNPLKFKDFYSPLIKEYLSKGHVKKMRGEC